MWNSVLYFFLLWFEGHEVLLSETCNQVNHVWILWMNLSGNVLKSLLVKFHKFTEIFNDRGGVCSISPWRHFETAHVVDVVWLRHMLFVVVHCMMVLWCELHAAICCWHSLSMTPPPPPPPYTHTFFFVSSFFFDQFLLSKFLSIRTCIHTHSFLHQRAIWKSKPIS